MPQSKSINFCCNRPKIKLFLHKNCKISERWGLRPQTPLPPAVGGVAPKPPKASCGRDSSYLIDNSFVIIFYCLFDVLSSLTLVKCLIVWQYFCIVGGNDCAYSIESAPWKNCPPLALLTFRHPCCVAIHLRALVKFIIHIKADDSQIIGGMQSNYLGDKSPRASAPLWTEIVGRVFFVTL